jgi:Mn2+/Fe2+ NRAMP family transporter
VPAVNDALEECRQAVFQVQLLCTLNGILLAFHQLDPFLVMLFDSFLQAVALFGSLIMPHNIYLHSALVSGESV